MKVFVSIDMEGVSGLVRWADVVTDGIDYERNRSLLTADANAAAEGAFDAGADEVVIEENHGVQDLCNLRVDEVDERCRFVRGAGRPTATTMAALDASVDVVLLVGHHARAGSRPGIMAHTVSYTEFRSVRVGGAECGESEIFAMRAGELGVPVGLIAGDQVVVEQLRARVPQAEAAVVKQALSNVAAECLHPVPARGLIRAAAKRAVERAGRGELVPYTGERAPYEIEVELRNEPAEGLRQNLERLPEFQWVGERTVATLAPDMDQGFRRIAYLGFGSRPGLLRY